MRDGVFLGMLVLCCMWLQKPSDCIDFPQLTRYGEEKFEFFDRSLLKAVRQEESVSFQVL